jgi:hypothetical protein
LVMVQKLVWFHVHTTHSSMLKIFGYKVLQQVKTWVYSSMKFNN